MFFASENDLFSAAAAAAAATPTSDIMQRQDEFCVGRGKNADSSVMMYN
jgi:hypothetical protein